MALDASTPDVPLIGFARRPRLLDLYSGAGGCAVGYHRAGFDVTGVDVKKQPRYPFAHVVADALEYLREHGHEYDAIHASPPCQRYSRCATMPGRSPDDYPDLVGATRDLLVASGRPWVIENVEGSPLGMCAVLCGSMFGLRVYRHRAFESSVMMMAPRHPPHRAVINQPGAAWVRCRCCENHWCRIHERHVGECDCPPVEEWAVDPYTTGAPRARRKMAQWLTLDRCEVITVAGNLFRVADGREAMGIDWPMTRKELAQAIPPAYCEWIGRQLLRAMGG